MKKALKVIICVTFLLLFVCLSVACDKEEKHIHSFGDWFLFSPADTDCETRLYYRICGECSSIEWKNGNSSDHNWEVETTLPTCKAPGFDYMVCTICGKEQKTNYTPIAENNHDWKTVTTDPTCFERGYDTKTCSICDKEVIENYTPVKHDLGDYLFDPSQHWKECGKCGTRVQVEDHIIDAEGCCTVCEVGSVGIVYEIKYNYAIVVGYVGNLDSVKIPNTYNGKPVKEISGSAFQSCKALTKIVIPNTIQRIGKAVLPSRAIDIEINIKNDYAFVSYLGKNYLVGYTGDSKYLALPTDYDGENYSVYDYAFNNHDGITSVEIPSSVTNIGKYAFSGCVNLKHVEIGEGIKIIEDGLFSGCSSLQSVSLPSSITTIRYSAFFRCGITSIYYAGTSFEWDKIKVYYINNYELENATIYYNR